MVYLTSTITADQPMKMTKSTKPVDLLSKIRNKKSPNSTNQSIPCCEKSPSAIIDVVILIAVVIALGLLFFSFSKMLIVNSIEIMRPVLDIVVEDIFEAPVIYSLLGLGMMCTIVAAFAITIFANRRCGKPGCRGLYKAAEFDIQIETNDSVKKSDVLVKKFQLRGDHNNELEAKLKKMAPTNGRAVLIFRARCGCSIGRIEVPGPKKAKKVKK